MKKHFVVGVLGLAAAMMVTFPVSAHHRFGAYGDGSHSMSLMTAISHRIIFVRLRAASVTAPDIAWMIIPEATAIRAVWRRRRLMCRHKRHRR